MLTVQPMDNNKRKRNDAQECSTSHPVTPPNTKKQKQVNSTDKTPSPSKPYYGQDTNLIKKIGLNKLRENAADSKNSSCNIYTPFLTNGYIVNEMVENANAGVKQAVYINTTALHQQYGKQHIEKLRNAGIPVYITPHLHTKSMQYTYTDENGKNHNTCCINSANYTYNGLFNNAGDSILWLPEDQHSQFENNMQQIHAYSTSYEDYYNNHKLKTPPRNTHKTLHETTPEKTVVSSWNHDISQQIVQSINNTQDGDTITFGTFTCDDQSFITSLNNAKERGVNVIGYVDKNTRLPDTAKNLVIHSVDAGKGRQIYHGKEVIIERANGDNTIYYGTGNRTKRSASDNNQFFITKTPRSSRSIQTALNDHILSLRRKCKVARSLDLEDASDTQ